VDPKDAPATMAALAVLLAFFSASQDIVSDAYRADVLPTAERASGTATFLTGYRVAMLVAGAAAFILSDHVPWPRVYQLMGALLVVVGVAATVFAPEPEVVRAPRTLADAVVKPFTSLFSRRGAGVALAFVLLYKFGEYVSDAMTVPFLIKTGFSNTDMVVVVAGDTFCRGMAAAAFGAFMLSICDQAFSATQLALLSSASSFCGRLFGGASGYLAATFGWPAFYAFTIFMALPGLLLLPWLPVERDPPPVTPR